VTAPATVEHTWTRQSAGGTWWWGCHPCGVQHPTPGGGQHARTLARKHTEGPRHARNVRGLAGKGD
jgi:hypothetical protein